MSENGTVSARQRTNYHMGMEATLKLKYDDVHDSIETLANVHLGQDPPYLDLLILKKDPGLELSDEIGSFFKENNVIENKGYGDGISINDVFKVQGYGGMYMSLDRNVDEIPWETMTVTVMQYQHPRAAFGRLKEMGCEIKERVSGCVYEVSGPPIMFPFQLVNASGLGDDWAEIKAMIPGAEVETIKKVMQEYHGEDDPRKRQHLRAILRISYANNNEAVERMKETGEMDENRFIETARLLFPEEYERANELEAKNKRLEDELEAKDQQLEDEMRKRETDKENTIQSMLKDNISATNIAKWMNVSLEKVAEVARKNGIRSLIL